MTNLIQIHKGMAAVSSRRVSDDFKKNHQHILEKIRFLTVEISTVPLPDGFNPIFVESKYLNKQGKEQPEYLMNRDAFTELVSNLNGKKAREWKRKYHAAFNHMENLLAEKQTEEWQKARIQGKGVRREFTDAIKEFVELAESQGHYGTAKLAYSNFSKLIKKPFGTRDGAGAGQLAMIAATEHVLGCTIFAMVRAGGDAKDIYNNVREKAHALTGIMLPALGA